MFASRAVRIVAFLAGTAVAGQALGATPAIVVDADSGRVLHAERATDPWFPASITKLMTAYVALDLVRQGRVRMDQLLTMTESAAANPPSKMGFKPGSQLTLENALKIIMVKSANDVAAMIGESLAGSVDDFAALMNDASQRLGMSESHWTNQHGLPDPRQKTSARDMAILAQAILREFPQHAELFKIGAIRFGRIVMRNHNGLLGRYPGTDGMKTGFICSSGFNVVTTATQNGRRLIAVVLGGTTANERNLRAADLLDRGFAAPASWAAVIPAQLPPSNLVAPPDMRPTVCDRRGPLPAEEDGNAATAAAGNTNDNSNAPALAFAGGAPVPTRTTLGPRAAFEPVRVWLGPTPPPSEVAETKPPAEPKAPVAAKPPAPERKQVVARPEPKPEPKAEPKPVKAQAKAAPKPASKPAARPGSKPAGSSEAFASTSGAASIIDDGKAKARGVTPADALKPAKAAAGAKKPEAKPAKAAQAKPAAAKPATAAKPAVTPKTAAKPAPKGRKADDE